MRSLEGVRVFVVDDEPLLMLEMQDLLAEFGCVVVGSAMRVDQAIDLARRLTYDLAILDVNIDGERIDPVADVVVQRGGRVVFLTGYGSSALGRPAHGLMIEKPCEPAELSRVMRLALGAVDA